MNISGVNKRPKMSANVKLMSSRHKKANFASSTEDTMEIASYLYVKIVYNIIYKHYMTCSKVNAWRGMGPGID